MRPTLIIAAAGFAAFSIISGPVWAQANRTFVSGLGSDSNPCSLAAPCRSFAGAITQTNPGGEILVLDSAGYGTVTITKAVSIVAPDGIEGGITTAAAGDGITISAGASDVVNLRGLTLNGGGVGKNGITFNTGANLNIQNCVIRGFSAPTGSGLNLIPTGTADIDVSNTIISGNFGYGVHLQPSGTNITVTASFEQVQAIHNGTGFSLDGTSLTGNLFPSVLAVAADSLASGNASGFSAVSGFGQGTTTLTLVNSKSANNGVGLESTGDNAAIFLNGSTISNSTVASFLILPGAVILSYGNNAIFAASSAGDNTGTLTPAALQ